MAKKKKRKPKGSNSPTRVTPKPVKLEDEMPAVTVQTTTTTMHQGPLPSPEVLKQYDQVQPGLAERIVRLAERPLEMAAEQQRHRIAMETRVIRSDIRRSWGGLIVGAVIVFSVLSIGVWCIASGRPAYGFAAILTSLASLVGVFVHTSQQRAEERRRVERDALVQAESQ